MAFPEEENGEAEHEEQCHSGSEEEEKWTASRLDRSDYKDLGSPKMVGNRFLRYLLSSTRCVACLLTVLRTEPTTTSHFSLEIDTFALMSHDPVLGTMLLRFPATLLPLLEEAITAAQNELLQHCLRLRGGQPARPDAGSPSANPRTKLGVHARLVRLPPHSSCCKPSLSSIVASDVGKIVQISGTVVRASPLRMYESSRAYRCKVKDCGYQFTQYADLNTSSNALPSPTFCPNATLGESGCTGTKFDVIVGQAIHTDYQEIKIQESASRLGIGSIPRSVLVKLEHDLVDTCKPGDDVFIVGSLMAQWQPVVANLECHITMALRAHSIRIVNAEETSTWDSTMHQSLGFCGGGENSREKWRKEFQQYWERSLTNSMPIAARNFIVKAVCPKLHGLVAIKLALLLTLIGGSSHTNIKSADSRSVTQHTENHKSSDVMETTEPEAFTLSNEGNGSTTQSASKMSVVLTKRREQSHMLLVGDPGTGKSQLLRFAATLSPRSVLTTGVGTTSAGLTCAAVKDKKEFTLEAGALVLADRGVCCIDEFGCIRDEDRTTIHEAMEQQTLSVAKAGIVCKLNCRATVLAATNAKGGLFDPDSSLSKNTGLGSPLLSRFDLIFQLVDSSEIEHDDKVASHLLNQAIQGHGYACTPIAQSNTSEGPWHIEKLRSYIATIKGKFQPVISAEAALLLEKHYQDCRKVANPSVAVTVRLFESLIRLSQAHARLMFRNVVTLQDAVAIVLLMECSASSTGGPTGFDEVTSSIDPMRGDFPVDEDADNMFRRSQWRLLRHHGMTEMIPVPERVAEDDNPGEAYHSQHSISETQQWNQGQDAFGRCRSSLFSLSQGQTGTATSRRMTGDNHYSPCERHNEWHHYEDQRHTKSHQRNVLSSIQGGDVMQTNGITPTPKMNRKRFRRAEAD